MLAARKLLLATGVVDEIPALEGIEPLYGRSVFHCPYCDGWEWRDRPLAVYARGERALRLTSALWTWSRDLVVCSDGPLELDDRDGRKLRKLATEVREDRISRLEAEDGRLQRIVFRSGDALPRAAMFFALGQRQRSPLPRKLGCPFLADEHVATGEKESTPVRGLFVAGDASRSVQLAIIAAAEGAEAAFAINKELQEEDQAPLLG